MDRVWLHVLLFDMLNEKFELSLEKNPNRIFRACRIEGDALVHSQLNEKKLEKEKKAPRTRNLFKLSI